MSESGRPTSMAIRLLTRFASEVTVSRDDLDVNGAVTVARPSASMVSGAADSCAEKMD